MQESTKDEIIYVRWAGRHDENRRPVGLELCVGRKVYDLPDEVALAIVKKVVDALL